MEVACASSQNIERERKIDDAAHTTTTKNNTLSLELLNFSNNCCAVVII